MTLRLLGLLLLIVAASGELHAQASPVASTSQGLSGGYTTLAVRGTASTGITSGSWYAIDGKRSKNHTTQSGLWAADAADVGFDAQRLFVNAMP